jgi:hypothetical protein
VEWEEVYGPNHQTWIHHAVKDRKYKAAEALLEAGAKLDTLGIGGCTLLHTAFRIHFSSLPPMDALDEAFADKLLTKGADINQGDNRGFTPLITASWAGKTGLVKYIISKGGDPNKPVGDQVTLLMEMARNGGWDGNAIRTHEILPLLLDAGADVNAVSRHGMTALSCAADTKTAQMLLEAGADPEHKDEDGKHIWESEPDDAGVVGDYIRQEAFNRRGKIAKDTLDSDVDAACHDGVAVKPVKRIVLKNKP